MAVDRQAIERHVLECIICFELYNDENRQPRILPCQHTFCISCLRNVWQSDKLVCSKCKAENTVRNVDDLPKDNTRRDLMDILNQQGSNTRNVSIDNGYEMRYKEITELAGRLETKVGDDQVTRETNEALLQEKNSYLSMKRKIQKLIEEYKGILEKRENILLDKLDETHMQNQKVLNQTLGDLSNFRLQAGNAISRVENLGKESDKRMALDSLDSLGSEVQRLLGFESRIEGIQQLIFTEACTTEDFEKIIGAIGSLTTRSEIMGRYKPSQTERSHAEASPESIQGLVESFHSNQTPQLMEVLKSVNMSGHLYMVSSPLPSCASQPENCHPLPSGHTQPQPSDNSLRLPSGNRQRLTADKTQNVPHLNHELLAPEISRPLSSEISQPMPSNLPETSIPSSSSFIPLHASPESSTNISRFGAKLTIANMTNGKRRILESPIYRAIVHSRFQTHRLVGDWKVVGEEVTVYANSVDEVERCQQIMEDSVCEKTIAVRQETMLLVNSDKWLEVERMQYSKYPNQISLDVIHGENKVIVYSTSSTILLDVHDGITIFFRENDLKVMLLKFNDKRIIAFIMKQKKALRNIMASWSHYCVGVRKVGDNTLEVKGIGVGLGQVVRSVYALAKKCMTAEDEDERFDDSDSGEDEDEERFENTPTIGEVNVELKLSGIDNLSTKQVCTINANWREDSKLKVPPFPRVTRENCLSINVTTRSVSLIGDDRVVYVLHGDVTELPVEAIVNPANKKLKHDGGLAKVLVQKGGRCIQDECRDYIRQNADMQVGRVMVSGAGTLNPRVLLHTVGPKWIDGSKEEESLLEQAVFNSLMEANRRMLISVAIPAIGAGAYRFPVEISAKCIVKAVKEFFLAKPTSSIREIYLVDLSPEIMNHFTEKLGEIYPDSEHVVSKILTPPSPIQFLVMPQP